MVDVKFLSKVEFNGVCIGQGLILRGTDDYCTLSEIYFVHNLLSLPAVHHRSDVWPSRRAKNNADALREGHTPPRYKYKDL